MNHSGSSSATSRYILFTLFYIGFTSSVFLFSGHGSSENLMMALPLHLMYCCNLFWVALLSVSIIAMGFRFYQTRTYTVNIDTVLTIISLMAISLQWCLE